MKKNNSTNTDDTCNVCSKEEKFLYIKNRRDVIIYISGAYMGKDNGKSIDSNIRLAREAAIELWEKGFTVICPHLNTQNFEKDCTCKYEDYLTGDTTIVKRVDAVFMLENWMESQGASVEKATVEDYNIPVFFTIKKVEEYFENFTN